MPTYYEVKQEWRSKTFGASGSINARGAKDVYNVGYISGNCQHPAGYQHDSLQSAANAGAVGITLPGNLTFTAYVEWDWREDIITADYDNFIDNAARDESFTFLCVQQEGYAPYWTPGDLIFRWQLRYGVIVMDEGTSIKQVSYDARASGPMFLVNGSAAPRVQNAFSYTVPFTVEVSGPFDLYAAIEAIATPDAAVTDLYPNDGGCCWLPDQTIYLHERESVDQADSGKLKVSVTFDSVSEISNELINTFEGCESRPAWITPGYGESINDIIGENKMQVYVESGSLMGVGYGLIDGLTSAQVVVERDYSSYPSATDYGEHSYNHTSVAEDAHNVTIELDGATISISGGRRLTTEGYNHDSATLIDYGGKHTAAYTNDLTKYLDGTEVAGVEFEALEGNPEYVDNDWEWPSEATGFTQANAVFTYTGHWELRSRCVEEGDDYYTGADGLIGIAYCVDQPSNPGSNLRITHGGLRVTNCAAIDEPDHTTWGDWRVLLRMAETAFKWDAFAVALAGTGEVATPLTFTSTSGWTASDCTLAIDSGQFQLSNVVAGAYVQKDLTSEFHRFTGGAFAKVYWTADTAGAELDVTISGHKWHLIAAASGAQVSLIDLCRPGCEQSDGSAAEDDTLKYNTDNGSLRFVSSGALARDCCCWTCAADQQQQTILDIEKAYGIHAFAVNRGWGVGRVTTVKLEPLTEGVVYHVEKITLYRKTAQEGGFARVVLAPQCSWNDTQALSDFVVFDQGGDYKGPRVGYVVIDGAIVAECVIGWWRYTFGAWMFWPALMDPAAAIRVFPWTDYTATENQELDTNGVLGLTVPAHTAEFFEQHACAGYLDPRRGELTDEDMLTATIRTDRVNLPCGFGNLPAVKEKLFRGCVEGLVFQNEARHEGSVSVQIGTDTPIDVDSNTLGWFSSPALKTTEACEVDGYLAVSTAGRHYSRAIVSKS